MGALLGLTKCPVERLRRTEVATKQFAAQTHLLADLVDTLRRMNEPPRFGGIRTLAGLRERGQEIEAAYQRHMLMREEVWLKLRFPPTPVPGTNDIVPLTEPIQLREESREQHNCVWGYCERVAAEKMFIYHVLKQERATLLRGACPQLPCRNYHALRSASSPRRLPHTVAAEVRIRKLQLSHRSGAHTVSP